MTENRSFRLRQFGCIAVHSALVVFPFFIALGFLAGTATVQDVNIASASLALGFVVYFQYMSNRTYEPSTLSYLVLIFLGLGSLTWVWGYEVAHFPVQSYALLAALLRFTALSLFIVSLELATGDLPKVIVRALPNRLTPDIPQDAFIRPRHPDDPDQP